MRTQTKVEMDDSKAAAHLITQKPPGSLVEAKPSDSVCFRVMIPKTRSDQLPETFGFRF